MSRAAAGPLILNSAFALKQRTHVSATINELLTCPNIDD